MRFTEHTTTVELLAEFSDQVLQLVDKIEVGYKTGKDKGLDERDLAYKTRKKILRFFFENGGM